MRSMDNNHNTNNNNYRPGKRLRVMQPHTTESYSTEEAQEEALAHVAHELKKAEFVAFGMKTVLWVDPGNAYLRTMARPTGGNMEDDFDLRTMASLSGPLARIHDTFVIEKMVFDLRTSLSGGRMHSFPR